MESATGLQAQSAVNVMIGAGLCSLCMPEVGRRLALQVQQGRALRLGLQDEVRHPGVRPPPLYVCPSWAVQEIHIWHVLLQWTYIGACSCSRLYVCHLARFHLVLQIISILHQTAIHCKEISVKGNIG